MDIKTLQSALSRAAALLQAGGAKRPAKALDDVASVIGSTGDATVEEFVVRTKEAMTEPSVELSSVEIAQSLHQAGSDEANFGKYFKIIQSKTVSKDQALEIAQYYIGSPKNSWKSKAQALKAIRAKFDERAFSDKRSQANSAVTPW